MSQRTYATYDMGKTQKVPYDFIKQFAYHYRVNEAWLMGEDAPWDQFELADMQFIKEKLSDRVPEVAERMRLPVAFVQAVFAGEVEGAKELWQSINRQFTQSGAAPAQNYDLNMENTKLAAENARLRSDVATLTAAIANLNDHIALLKSGG